MLKRPHIKRNNNVDTFVGKGTFMQGNLEAEGIVHIEGYFEGEIVTKSEIIIGTEAKVKADIKAANVTLAGDLMGNVKTSEKLFIRSSGALVGDINVGSLSVEEGAFFKGNCTMEKQHISVELRQSPEIGTEHSIENIKEVSGGK